MDTLKGSLEGLWGRSGTPWRGYGAAQALFLTLDTGFCSFWRLRLTDFRFELIFLALSDTADSMKPSVFPQYPASCFGGLQICAKIIKKQLNHGFNEASHYAGRRVLGVLANGH